MKCVSALILLLPFAVFAQQKEDKGFVINGTIPGLPDNSIVYLAGNSEQDTIAKAMVKQNSFVLKGKFANTDGAMLILTATKKRIFLFIENETVQLSASDASLSNVVVTGSPTHADYEEFMNEIKPLSDFVGYYRSEMQNAQTQGAHDTAAIMLNTAYNIFQTSIDRFLSRRPNSPVAALLLAYSYDTDPNKDVDLLEKRFASLGKNAGASRYGIGVKNAIDAAKIGAVGTAAINFTQPDTTGKKVSLAQFKGRYVLIDFWASWCRPCRMENPNVVAAYNAFKDKNFTILSVSLDHDKDSWLKAIKADGLTWTHVNDLDPAGNAAARLYNVATIPQNFLVDPNGIIIAKNLRGETLEEALQQLVK